MFVRYTNKHSVKNFLRRNFPLKFNLTTSKSENEFNNEPRNAHALNDKEWLRVSVRGSQNYIQSFFLHIIRPFIEIMNQKFFDFSLYVPSGRLSFWNFGKVSMQKIVVEVTIAKTEIAETTYKNLWWPKPDFFV